MNDRNHVEDEKAFPVVRDEGLESDGMDLRDYFAAKAMQAFIANDMQYRQIPRNAYIMADRMMEVREEYFGD